jgi:formate hydrogenlyase transcriptional activator
VSVSEVSRDAAVTAGSLLDIAADVHIILHNVSFVLSKLEGFQGVALLLPNDDSQSVRLYTQEHQGACAPAPPSIQDVSCHDATLTVLLEEPKPLHLHGANGRLASVLDLIQLSPVEKAMNAHILALPCERKHPGLLIVITSASEECDAQQMELMNSVSRLLSKLMETTLALEMAESYKQSLARERDRLKLILDINNHTITHLDMAALFRAASKSLRAFFDNALTAFWLFEERSHQLDLLTLDFPTGLGFRENTTTAVLQEADIANMRARIAAIFGAAEIDQFPAAIAKPLRDDGIVSMVCVPLVGVNGPLGLISIGSRDKDAFLQDDLELLSQIANQISLALDNALAYRRISFSCRRLEEERHYLESELNSQSNFEDIVGKSAAIQRVLEQAAIVASTDSTVLLIGESGTGKELVARAIHNLSLRRDRTFVRLNCAAVPSGLLESELFGHEKGAFTGALAQKRGRIELAHQGSLFLDEIGDINLELQPKLLRILQEREFERLGSNHTIKVDTRLIAATHRDLPAMMRKGEFRDDLFYRLNVFPIHIPPLRDRKEDIPLLVHYFVANLSRKMRKSIRNIPARVMDAITNFSWPGNIRELQNFIERSVILSRDETLAAPISELGRGMVSREMSSETFHGMERETILNVLRATEGKLSGPGGAAQRLGLKRTTLQRKMERLGILKSDYA